MLQPGSAAKVYEGGEILLGANLPSRGTTYVPGSKITNNNP